MKKILCSSAVKSQDQASQAKLQHNQPIWIIRQEKQANKEQRKFDESHLFEDLLRQVVQRGPFVVEAASDETHRVQKLLTDLRLTADEGIILPGATDSVDKQF